LPPDPRRMTTPRFVLGVFLVLMGISLTLDQLGVVPAHHLMRFWPAVLIVLGLSILQRGRKHGAVTGLVLIIAGTWLLLNTLGLVSLNLWEFLWPLILVVIGARIMLRSHRESWRDQQPPPPGSFSPSPVAPPDGSPGTSGLSGSSTPSGPSTSPGPSATSGFSAPSPSPGGSAAGFPDQTSIFSFMSSCRRRWANAPFRSAEATCLLGGFHLDLRNAVMGPDGSAHIEVLVIMGGMNISVPPNWTVVSHVTPLLGGIDDKTRTPSSTPTQQLILRGTVVMGGIEITN
jgi:predicted membrane protein